jgi:hypothetical protein
MTVEGSDNVDAKTSRRVRTHCSHLALIDVFTLHVAAIELKAILTSATVSSLLIDAHLVRTASVVLSVQALVKVDTFFLLSAPLVSSRTVAHDFTPEGSLNVDALFIEVTCRRDSRSWLAFINVDTIVSPFVKLESNSTLCDPTESCTQELSRRTRLELARKTSRLVFTDFQFLQTRGFGTRALVDVFTLSEIRIPNPSCSTSSHPYTLIGPKSVVASESLIFAQINLSTFIDVFTLSFEGRPLISSLTGTTLLLNKRVPWFDRR